LPECQHSIGNFKISKLKIKIHPFSSVPLLSLFTMVNNVLTALLQPNISIFRQENVKPVQETLPMTRMNVIASIIGRVNMEFRVAL
jgi:hypothetical protein